MKGLAIARTSCSSCQWQYITRSLYLHPRLNHIRIQHRIYFRTRTRTIIHPLRLAPPRFTTQTAHYPPPTRIIPRLCSPLTTPINSGSLHTQLVIPPYRAYDGQLWFSTPPTYVGGPYQDQPLPPRPASTNVGATQASILPAGLPVSGTPDHLHKHYSYQQPQHYPPQPEETTGHGARAARISHHLRSTSRARSASPPALIVPPTQVTVDLIAPKPMLSPKVVTETLDATDNDDPIARSFGGVGTRTRSLSVVKLEEMAARAASETESKARAQKGGRGAAVDKTLPVPPVPSGKPSGYGPNRRVFAQDIFQQMVPQEETMGGPVTEAGSEMIPQTPSLSALSLLRPPPRRDGLGPPSYGGQGDEESGLDALERHLAEQVGTRKPPPLPPPDLRTALDLGSISPRPPPPPVPAPVPVPGKKSMAQERADDVDAGAAVNESAISSLALGAEEDFGGRNANTNTNPNLNLALPDVQIEGEEEVKVKIRMRMVGRNVMAKAPRLAASAARTKRGRANPPSPIRKKRTKTRIKSEGEVRVKKGRRRGRRRGTADVMTQMMRPRASGLLRRAALRNGWASWRHTSPVRSRSSIRRSAPEPEREASAALPRLTLPPRPHRLLSSPNRIHAPPALFQSPLSAVHRFPSHLNPLLPPHRHLHLHPHLHVLSLSMNHLQAQQRQIQTLMLYPRLCPFSNSRTYTHPLPR
ncbi:hypothetical protein BGY98DRAFT_304537 [Russula aff. rugulosa BPL654]|nr:hypothetical protein BGY98DRAFT_304537 [Russula aff. rugulosa BPL654]